MWVDKACDPRKKLSTFDRWTYFHIYLQVSVGHVCREFQRRLLLTYASAAGGCSSHQVKPCQPQWCGAKTRMITGRWSNGTHLWSQIISLSLWHSPKHNTKLHRAITGSAHCSCNRGLKDISPANDWIDAWQRFEVISGWTGSMGWLWSSMPEADALCHRLRRAVFCSRM